MLKLKQMMTGDIESRDISNVVGGVRRIITVTLLSDNEGDNSNVFVSTNGNTYVLNFITEELILEKPTITKRDEVKEITTGALQLQLMLMLSILLNKKTCKYYILEAINRFT
uniref:Uncharacterized protein n=1 Tax=Glossina pallidipes TaxID=7398 RepID=A0A1B0GGQ2_GLOPL